MKKESSVDERGVWKSRNPESGTGAGNGNGNGNGTGTGT